MNHNNNKEKQEYIRVSGGAIQEGKPSKYWNNTKQLTFFIAPTKKKDGQLVDNFAPLFDLLSKLKENQSIGFTLYLGEEINQKTGKLHHKGDLSVWASDYQENAQPQQGRFQGNRGYQAQTNSGPVYFNGQEQQGPLVGAAPGPTPMPAPMAPQQQPLGVPAGRVGRFNYQGN